MMGFVWILAETKESLTWALGNNFALAVWWVLSGVVSGAFLALFGMPITFMITGRRDRNRTIERRIGTIGGLLVGLSGGATVGTINDFSGLLGHVYLWGFVGMMYAVFLGTYAQDLKQTGFEEHWRKPGPPLDPMDQTISVLDELSATFSKGIGTENRVDEMFGVFSGGVVGIFYGTMSALLLPLSTTQNAIEEVSNTVVGAALVWTLLAGFAGWVGARRIGTSGGLVMLVTGLLLGSMIGGFVALLGQILGDMICGAVNGAVGGAFFGQVAAAELMNRRILD